jgi:hypothetical protein
MQGRQPGRKTRWTQEQIEALIEGVERHGLSAWRTIVQVGRGSGAGRWVTAWRRVGVGRGQPRQGRGCFGFLTGIRERFLLSFRP